jgi:hypothetical protein
MRLGRSLLVALVVLLVAVPAGAAPEGQMTWAIHISLAPTWFDPAEATGIATPFMVIDAGDLWCDMATTTMAEAFAGYLQTAGIRVKVRPLERAAFFKAYQEKKLKNLVYGLSGAFGNAASRLENFVVAGARTSTEAIPTATDCSESRRPSWIEASRGDTAQDPAAGVRQGNLRTALGAGLYPRAGPPRRGVRSRADHRMVVLGTVRGCEAQGEVNRATK